MSSSSRQHKKAPKPTKRERKAAEKAARTEAEAPAGAADKAVKLLRGLKKLLKGD